VGRVKAYEAIVKGENIARPNIPESFKVLMKEIQSLALDISVQSEEGAVLEVRDEEDDLLRAAEELGIDLSSVRPRQPEGVGADEQHEAEVETTALQDVIAAGTGGDEDDELFAESENEDEDAGLVEVVAAPLDDLEILADVSLDFEADEIEAEEVEHEDD